MKQRGRLKGTKLDCHVIGKAPVPGLTGKFMMIHYIFMLFFFPVAL